jgi:hypothetical protein
VCEKLWVLSWLRTLSEAWPFLGEAPCPVALRDTHPNAAISKRIAHARKLFAAGKPVLGKLASTYLQGRVITRQDLALCYHPRALLRHGEDDFNLPQRSPALLAKITDNRGQVTGCARFYLDLSIGGLTEIESPKRILAQVHGHAIRFWSGPRRILRCAPILADAARSPVLLSPHPNRVRSNRGTRLCPIRQTSPRRPA